MENYEASFLPSVKDPVSAVEQSLDKYPGNIITVDDISSIDTIDLKSGGSNFVVVTLPSTSHGQKLEKLLEIGTRTRLVALCWCNDFRYVFFFCFRYIHI